MSLLDQGMRLARSDPVRAQQLTQICADLAAAAAAPAVLPRVTYLRAQTHAIRGEFQFALGLIRSAQERYEGLGLKLEALRTQIGLMHVLNELGRHTEALEAGRAVLDALEGLDGSDPQAMLVAALAHQNQGVVFETMGRYDEALDAYARAESRFTELQMTERLGDIRNNRGIVLVHLGRVTEAQEAFESAAAIWAGAGLSLLQAQTLSNLGEAHLVLGNYTRSLQAFEQARRLFESLEAQANLQILLRKTADAYLALNLYPEALAAYREVSELLKQAGVADHRARALWGMGATLSTQARHSEAEEALAEAAGLFKGAGNTPMLCSVMLEQAALQDARGQREAALRTAREALALLSAEEWPVQQVYACMRAAELVLPDTAEAEPYLSDAQRLSDSLGLPTISYRLNSRLGHLRRLQGRDPEARTCLEAAVAQIERLRGNLAQEVFRTSFLRDKTAAYEDLIHLHLACAEAEGVRQAFLVAEQAKSRTLVDLLAGVASTEPVVSEDPALTTRLQSLRADLDATYDQFLGAAFGPKQEGLAELQARAVRLESEITRLQLQAAGRAAHNDPFAVSLSFEAVQEQLPMDLSLLVYHILGEEVLAFLYGQGEVRVVRDVTQASVVQELLQRLNIQWDRVRANRSFAQRHMAALEQSARRVLAHLYTELVAPVEFWLKQSASAPGAAAAKLAIVPHGVLHQVPFHALHDGAQYMLDRFEVSYAPSVTVLTLCQRREQREPERGLAVGLADAVIPAAEAEAELVARQLEEAGVPTEVRLGDEAKLRAVTAVAPGRTVLHLACHGLFRSDNPMFSGLKLHDGWLAAADVMPLNLEGALVTLSACESGRSLVISGDEVIGLPRAFLGAGAATVVVSLWVVSDEATAALMTHFYRNLHSFAGRAAALRAAQQALKAQFPHPWYWAAFVLIGQR